MTDLDSRLLRYLDCFGQKFSTAGKHRYGLGLQPSPAAQDFTIDVGAKPNPVGATQHHVTVAFAEGKHKPDHDPIEIALGDVVTWSSVSESMPPFSVFGDGPSGTFENGKMRHECIYTHVFTVPRVHAWIDAHGGGAAGSITVKQVKVTTQDEYKRWFESVKKASVVHIQGKKFDNAALEIPVGGTVCWAIENTGGIAVTDRLLTPSLGAEEPAHAPSAGQGRSSSTRQMRSG